MFIFRIIFKSFSYSYTYFRVSSNPGSQIAYHTAVFLEQVPLNRGYRCERGVFVYSTDMERVVYAINITDEPCEMNQMCAMQRFQNTDDSGNRGKLPYG